MKVKRSLYLGYYLKELDRDKFNIFLNYISKQEGQRKSSIIKDIITSVFEYNISILEYFQFRFYDLPKEERALWAGTGYMYEYQLAMNPKNHRHILDDKTLFYKQYENFFGHTVASIADLRQNSDKAEQILNNSSGKVVFKPADGKCGAQVVIKNSSEFDRFGMIEFMEDHDLGLVEEFIVQHTKMNQLSSSAVNTVRIITQLNEEGGVDILGCRLRISVNSPVDNMAAGNMAAPIDEDTGIVSGPGVYSDITKPDQNDHPVTNVEIPGFQIPFWKKTLQMVKEAALRHPQNRSIGWDVVITNKGPGLIEGNHDWCKLLWQLPVKRGLKSMLKDYAHSHGL
ncbi:hexapeptide transferase [Aliifodinibius salipaludis]|uniref:Hexapeptide transferase n=1 Tax=Fodinibius salipaludis TaxID=2032627 RepID=A0A2A2GAX9_9BACT|nr:sugar-transfer associated ATP-grasp domain-containing protein [Aliifodinibius salipaludis]PAU94023.1 hexapeptide transferase [Aliifodinibius salipaludis]